MYRDMVASGRPSRSHPSPPGASDAAARVAEAARAESARGAPLVIAVSGGRDSMVLMEAVARVAPARVASVATFDHGTGPAAVEATSLVRERASALGLPVRSGASRSPAHTEADWRAQRLAFLHEVAGELNARVITAHTLDDHLETVLMRALRGAGARGLAGLLASSAISRPFVTLRRSTIAACARAWAVPYLDDPTNVSRRHLRNRVRLDLLPALARAHPELPRDLVTLSRRAARLRQSLDRLIDASIDIDQRDGALSVARDALVDLDAPALALLWPAIAARHGVTLDRRGTERVVSFTIQGQPGSRIQVSGGVEVVRNRDRLVMRGVPAHTESPGVVRLEHGATWGRWRFVQTAAPLDRWAAQLDMDLPLDVRAWRPGDRMVADGSTEPRRLKGLFRDAGVDAVRRREWPVVVAGEQVVWVPGVRRAFAAPARSGRPNVTFRCEYIDR